MRKVAYGIYIDNNLIEDEFYILQKRFSNIVFSYNTACYLMNLSDRAPYKIDVTTINNNNFNEKLIKKDLLTMNLEQTAGAGDYKSVTYTEWPREGYIFN